VYVLKTELIDGTSGDVEALLGHMAAEVLGH
jgi:hypothetical protein